MSNIPDSTTIDEIDRRILAILAKDPRIPYSDISHELAEEGFELSSEAVRQRVTSLLDVTTSFFLLRPDAHEWEIVLVTVRTEGGTGAKADVFEAMSEMSFWFVGSGFGTVDIYAHATVSSTAEVDRLVNDVRELEAASEVDYFVETGRSTAVEQYLRVE
ncbi:Lrp/AsnC family transcriptional regulator [Haloglomus irregulare]|jgi:DNA-binding Lrp family transcriptional regulator|uniref:Lrp/AsnC family transcriptional regulator n=1 Tax=Haloglomus irregulare TaxID=2234134 RepID=A0A554MWG1_9EURY|nr:Lrp/AsnC family transcriptional regulator [Haloglomus irregulare]TSD09150.1 Lrp/AsnC family transcriptional regulator [Haloglomus irregulare]